MRLLEPQDVPESRRAFVQAMAERGGLINVYRAMAHSPEALKRLWELLAFLWYGAVDERLREIAILTVVSASDAPYPLGWHLLDAADAGLTQDEIWTVVGGQASKALPEHEATVAEFARADAGCARWGETLAAVAGFLDERQIVELTMIAGL